MCRPAAPSQPLHYVRGPPAGKGANLENSRKGDLESRGGSKERTSWLQDSQAHNSLLKVWSALRSEAIDNSVVEATIWKAFLSHNQTIRLGPRNELGHESKHPAVRSEDGERGEDPWFKVTVETIRTHEKAFNDVCVEFIHDPVVNTLNVQVPEEAPTSGSSNSDVCHGHLDFVLHTQSKGHVQLQFITGTSILLVDISLHPSQGEALIRQLGTIAGAEPIE